jgi:hypothetical protein
MGINPYLPSKNIVAVDEQNGIFVLKTNLFKNPDNSTEGGNPPGGGSVGTSTGSLPTGITEINYASQILVSPNPASDKVVVSLPVELMNVDMQVELIDIKGQVMIKQNTGNLKGAASYYKEINVTELQNGIYFLRLQHDKTIIKNSKLIIAR